MKNIVLLGSTGSIGSSTRSVVEQLPEHFRLVGLSVNTRYEDALDQAQQFGVPNVAVADPAMAKRCADAAPGGITVWQGAEGVEALAGMDGVDIVVCAVVGLAGLRPVMAAAAAGTDIALATKEVLVGAGGIVTGACAASGARLLPVDSEHSAIFQCLAAAGTMPDWSASCIRRLILTASGGPFGMNADIDLSTVSVEDALAHPRWRMGPKVTIDSATLMNKGLEIMEARWLFDVPVEQIDVLIHPESIVHSLVEFVDGNITAQLSMPDMRFAIQYALTYPDRVPGGLPSLDLAGLGALHFSEPDPRRFPALAMARDAARRGGTVPAVLNAANEIAVEKFLAGELSFPGRWETVAGVVACHDPVESPDLATIVEADKWARRKASGE